MSNIINVCLSCDDNYVKYAGVVIASILSNADCNDNLSIYILDGGILEEHKNEILSLKSIKDCEITFVNIDENLFEEYKKIKTHSYVTIATYYRLKLSSLLPDVDKIIYLDCDVVVNSSLKELFNTELGNNYIAGVLDARVKHKRKWKNTNYINAGLILYDLQKIKNNKIEQDFENYAKQNIDLIQTGDQDIINIVLKDKIKIIDDEWNVQVSGFASRTSFTNEPKVIHYIGCDKPWVYASITYFKDLYFKYLQLTPWKLTTEEEKYKWNVKNKKDSRKLFWKKRPYCIVSPKYWYAFIKSFLMKKKRI